MIPEPLANIYETVADKGKERPDESEYGGGQFYELINRSRQSEPDEEQHSLSNDTGGGGYSQTAYQPQEMNYGYENIEVSMMENDVGSGGVEASPGRGEPQETSVDYSEMDVDSLIDMMG